MEENHYYPFGMLMEGLSTEGEDAANTYKYQDNELQTKFDYNVEEFALRHYDPAIARWTMHDPVTQFANPYIGMGNNPVRQIDPMGSLTNWSGPGTGGGNNDGRYIYHYHGGTYLGGGGIDHSGDGGLSANWMYQYMVPGASPGDKHGGFSYTSDGAFEEYCRNSTYQNDMENQRYIASGGSSSDDDDEMPSNNYREFSYIIHSNNSGFEPQTEIPKTQPELFTAVVDINATTVNGLMSMTNNNGTWKFEITMDFELKSLLQNTTVKDYFGAVEIGFSDGTIIPFRLKDDNVSVMPAGYASLGYASCTLPTNGNIDYILVRAGYDINEYAGYSYEDFYNVKFNFDQ